MRKSKFSEMRIPDDLEQRFRANVNTDSGMVNNACGYGKNARGCLATFKKRQESDGSGRAGAVSCNHPEQLVDELNLSPTIRTAHPPRLPLSDHVHGLVALDRSPRRVECTKALLRRHASFDRSMILLHDVVQVLDRSVAATASQDSCLFHPRNCRAVETGLISVDAAGLRMRRISQRLAEQACGRSGIAPPREHEVDRGAAGIDGSVEVAPTVPPQGSWTVV